MKVAIIADWLTTFGGAEHAIAECVRVWPDAPLFTTVARPEKIGMLRSKKIHTTSLQKWYRLVGNHQVLLSRMPRAVEDIDLDAFDIILSSSHAVAKGIVPPSRAVHVCYCHTPMRYAWEMEDQYLDDFRVPRFLRPTIKRRLKELRRWDLTTAKRVDVFIANSTETQRRIRDVYAREAVVLPPPVADHFFHQPLSQARGGSYLALGRLVPYKRFDLLIDVANQLQLPLRIAGTGQEEQRLKKLAGPTVEFLGFVPDEDLPSLYATSRALLFPQFEDAGIVPLEAQACGLPVIAYGAGGALDSVKEEVTGLFFPQQSVESISEAVRKFEGMSIDPKRIREHAEQFSGARFRRRLEEIVSEFTTNLKINSQKHISSFLL